MIREDLKLREQQIEELEMELNGDTNNTHTATGGYERSFTNGRMNFGGINTADLLNELQSMKQKVEEYTKKNNDLEKDIKEESSKLEKEI